MKQSSFVIGLLLANSAAKQLRRPKNDQLFADGMAVDSDLVEKVNYMPDGSMRVGSQQRAQI